MLLYNMAHLHLNQAIRCPQVWIMSPAEGQNRPHAYDYAASS